MGERARKRAAFLERHPICCFCGGAEPASTIDHVPARTCFYKRVGPEGFEFPACGSCQTSTRLSELIFGFYARLMDPDDDRYDEGDAVRLFQGIRNNAPHLIPNLELPAATKRQALRDYGIEVPEVDLDDVPLVGVPTEFHRAATIVARKIVLATYYREMKLIAGPGSRVMARWSQLQIPQGADLHRQLSSYLPNKTVGTRVNTDIGDQFSYVWGFNPDDELFAICGQLCGSLMLLCAIVPPDRIAGTRHPREWLPSTGPLPDRGPEHSV